MILFPQDFVLCSLTEERSAQDTITESHGKKNNFSSHYLAAMCTNIYNFILTTRHNMEYIL